METLETKRLLLRDWRLSDADDLYIYASNPHIASLACWRAHTSREDSLNATRYFIDNPLSLALELKETGRVIGQLRIDPDRNRGLFSARESAKLLSYALSESYWNRGLMTEAVARAVQYTFEELQTEVLTAFHLPENISSQRVLEKCGFQ